MSTNPRVSIILTSYNHEKYLHEAIDSALNQTFSDFELIIFDDGSIDDSWAIIRSYLDPRIQAYQNKTTTKYGKFVRMNFLEKSHGEYIAIHHSDDIWEPDKLEKQVAFLDANPHIGAIFSRVQIID